MTWQEWSETPVARELAGRVATAIDRVEQHGERPRAVILNPDGFGIDLLREDDARPLRLWNYPVQFTEDIPTDAIEIAVAA